MILIQITIPRLSAVCSGYSSFDFSVTDQDILLPTAQSSDPYRSIQLDQIPKVDRVHKDDQFLPRLFGPFVAGKVRWHSPGL